MKKYAGLVFAGLCMLQGTASGADSCFNTINQGAATVTLGLYEQPCTTLDWNAGMITSDVKYNCCGASAVIRINYNDWSKLLAEGKLDGLRYQKFDIEQNRGSKSYTLTFRKVVGKELTTIKGEDFFK